jgi:glycosyltransferase involved in cell wall biosynthesis
MHILFLTDNFPPEVNAPASRTHEHCRRWVESGHRVTVVTGVPNFPKGRIFDGYTNKCWQQEVIDGIRVIRVWTYVTANEGFARRIFDYLSFMVSGAFAALFVRGVDVVVGTSPQFFTACAAWFVAGLKRRPFVFEVRDLWPESIKAVGAMRDSFALRVLERIEMFLYRRATRIVTVTEASRRTLEARGVAGSKIDVVTNGVDMSRFSPRSKDPALLRELQLEGKFVAGYVGTHGMAHALETVLQAAQILKSEPRTVMLLLGDGARKEALRREAEAMGLTNVIFIDSVSKEAVTRYWSILDVSIIHLRRTELFTTVIPSKLFECMGMGIPVLLGVAGEAAQIVEEHGVGLVFEPEAPSLLAAGIRRFLTQPQFAAECRSRCLVAAVEYDRSRLAGVMLAALHKATLQT